MQILPAMSTRDLKHHLKILITPQSFLQYNDPIVFEPLQCFKILGGIIRLVQHCKASHPFTHFEIDKQLSNLRSSLIKKQQIQLNQHQYDGFNPELIEILIYFKNSSIQQIMSWIIQQVEIYQGIRCQFVYIIDIIQILIDRYGQIDSQIYPQCWIIEAFQYLPEELNQVCELLNYSHMKSITLNRYISYISTQNQQEPIQQQEDEDEDNQGSSISARDLEQKYQILDQESQRKQKLIKEQQEQIEALKYELHSKSKIEGEQKYQIEAQEFKILIIIKEQRNQQRTECQLLHYNHTLKQEQLEKDIQKKSVVINKHSNTDQSNRQSLNQRTRM